jgi:hypothetical protein
VQVTSWWPSIIKGASFSIIVSCFLILFWTIGPYVETHFFPVVGKLTIEKIVPTEDGQSEVYAIFEKKRNCEYIGIAWYRGNRDIGPFERVALVLMRADGDDSSPNRPVGFQRSGPRKVSVPTDEILNNSFVELFHKCHPFWTTRTEFYP